MILYIIRHGQPNYEKDCLTELGWKQAEAVGRRMARSGINKIYASPMGRAQETATPASRLLGLEINTENWAHEIGDERLTRYPDGVRRSVSLLQNTYLRENGNMDLGYARAYECPGMNDTEMKKAVSYIEENGNEFLERLGYKEENGVYRIIRPNDDKVALFCHAAFSRAWISVLLHIPINIMWASFDYELTGVTKLEFKNNENGVTAPKALCFSDTSHLYAEDIACWH
ncbi:MAG: histidine phosphatase family protein [Clostridia bacterium]|nr:histidine phosphatase family protein [Clostridia bacterium]